MLKHNLPEEQAAQVRVTPEELTAAVAALEARKPGTSGTLAIGDAVEELSLDNTPEDILREVKARREHLQKQSRHFTRKRKWAVSLSLSLVCLTGFGIYSVTGNSYPDSSQLTPGVPPSALESGILVRNSLSQTATVTTLAEAPTEKTLYCSPDAIGTAAMSRNAQMGPRREISQSIAELNWPIVKHGQEIYVRGWTSVRLSPQAARLADVQVFSTPSLPTLGAHPQPITLKLDLHTSLVGLGYQRLSRNGPGYFVFHNPRTTPHTYEKWQP